MPLTSQLIVGNSLPLSPIDFILRICGEIRKRRGAKQILWRRSTHRKALHNEHRRFWLNYLWLLGRWYLDDTLADPFNDSSTMPCFASSRNILENCRSALLPSNCEQGRWKTVENYSDCDTFEQQRWDEAKKLNPHMGRGRRKFENVLLSFLGMSSTVSAETENRQ